jgi:putative transport protein
VLAFGCVVGHGAREREGEGRRPRHGGASSSGISEAVDHHTLDFVKEFGLILFVFPIGLQLGPGFFATLRQPA